MPIRVIHGNGDLIGAAFEGVGQGAQAFTDAKNASRALDDRERRTSVFQQEANRRVDTMQAQLAMEEEVHALKLQEFNRRMFDQQAAMNWRRQGAKLEGPGKYAEMREALALTDMSPELRAQEMAILDAEEQAEMRDHAAMGYRARVGEMIRQNPELAEQSLVAQSLMDPATLEAFSHEELPGVLEDLESDFRVLRQQRRDDMAALSVGQQLDELSNDPNLGYQMQEQIPRIIESLSDKYPPQALNNLLSGISGKVPMSSLMDGGATEAATLDYLHQRAQANFAQTPEGRAAIQAQARADAAGLAPGEGRFNELRQRDPRTLTLRERGEALRLYDQLVGDREGARKAAAKEGRKLNADLPVAKRSKMLLDFYAEAMPTGDPAQDQEMVAGWLAAQGVEPEPSLVRWYMGVLDLEPHQVRATAEGMKEMPTEDPWVSELRGLRSARGERAKKRKADESAEAKRKAEEAIRRLDAMGLTESYKPDEE